MGRASDIKSYVKQGAEIAETEIELKARAGKRNVVIWRRFTREDDKSEWRVDGELRGYFWDIARRLTSTRRALHKNGSNGHCQ